MRVQRALGISRGARSVDDQRRIVGGGVDGGKFIGSGFDRRPERFGAGVNSIAGDVDVLQIRQPVADFRQLLPPGLIGDDGPCFRIRQAKFQRVLTEQRE